MERQDTSPIPGVDRWSYGPFAQDLEQRSIKVPLVREDGTSTEFTVPDFVNEPHDLRQIATIVIAAIEKWEAVQGLGA